MTEPKTCLITGGTGGIGQRTAVHLAKHGFHVWITGRDPARATSAIKEMRREADTPDIHFLPADLSSIAGTMALAEQVSRAIPTLNVLINNAGALDTEPGVTEDGLNHMLAVNALAPTLLTDRLAPELERGRGRVVHVTGGLPSAALDMARFQPDQGSVGLASYTQSKRAMEAIALEHHQTLSPRSISLNVVYPGPANTAMTQAVNAEMLPWFLRPAFPLFRLAMRRSSPDKASRSSVYAATSPDLAQASGRYFDPKCRPQPFHRSILGSDVRRRLVAWVHDVSPTVSTLPKPTNEEDFSAGRE